MRRATIAALIATTLIAGPASASFTGIQAELEQVDIDGFGAADVWRIHAGFDNTADQLLVVYGDDGVEYPLRIATADGSAFYAHFAGSNTSMSQIPALIDILPELAYHSFFDIGATLSTDAGDVGVSPGFPSSRWWEMGELSGALSLYNYGSWQRTPGDPSGVQFAGVDERVFIGQFTVLRGVTIDGIFSLTMNEDGVTGQTYDVTFTVPAPAAWPLLLLTAVIGPRRRRAHVVPGAGSACPCSLRVPPVPRIACASA